MNVVELRLGGVLLLESRAFRDERGFFLETWNRGRHSAAGVPDDFAQDNVSFSRRGVLRGLHYQNPAPQGKLVAVLQGSIFDVAVDLRADSPTFAQWFGTELSAENLRQLYIPEGFAHGFLVTAETALVSYKCTAPYAPEHERSLRWDDPEIGIVWPLGNPLLSDRDQNAPLLSATPADHFFNDLGVSCST